MNLEPQHAMFVTVAVRNTFLGKILTKHFNTLSILKTTLKATNFSKGY